MIADEHAPIARFASSRRLGSMRCPRPSDRRRHPFPFRLGKYGSCARRPLCSRHSRANYPCSPCMLNVRVAATAHCQPPRWRSGALLSRSPFVDCSRPSRELSGATLLRSIPPGVLDCELCGLLFEPMNEDCVSVRPGGGVRRRISTRHGQPLACALNVLRILSRAKPRS